MYGKNTSGNSAADQEAINFEMFANFWANHSEINSNPNLDYHLNLRKNFAKKYLETEDCMDKERMKQNLITVNNSIKTLLNLL